jgi:predicted RecA/RadA family phage recombinase
VLKLPTVGFFAFFFFHLSRRIFKMGTALYRQDGDYVDHTPSGAVAVGDVVVMGPLLGVATRPIAASALGQVAVEGVFRFVKVSGFAVTQGQKMYYHATAGVACDNSTGVVAGYAVAAAASGDLVVDVLLNPGA